MQDTIAFVNAILLISPFTALLGAPDPTTTVEIANTDWALLAKAAGALPAERARVLKDMVIAHSVQQIGYTADDRRFWERIWKQMDAKAAAPVPAPAPQPGPDKPVHFPPAPRPPAPKPEPKPPAPKPEPKPAPKPDPRPKPEPKPPRLPGPA